MAALFSLVSDADAFYPVHEADVDGFLVRVKNLGRGELPFVWEVVGMGGYFRAAGTSSTLERAQRAGVAHVR